MSLAHAKTRRIGQHPGIGLLWVLGCSLALTAQTPALAPADLVRQAVENELNAADGSTMFMFRSRRETPRESQTKLCVQTREATAGLLIAINDQPLTPEQRRAEEERLQNLVINHDDLRRKQRQEKEDTGRVSRIMRAMPNAFIYQYDGTDVGKAGVGRVGGELIRLKFQPNPRYNAPSRVEQMLTGMQGYLLIDASKHRIARIDGTLYRDVSFGWGILGHLDKGGHFQVEQCEVGDSSWGITHLSLNFTGKILIFKSLVSRSDEVYSDFRRVPNDLTFAEGVALLKKQETTIPGNGNHGGGE
jgi:hypothetical protein